MFAVRFFHHAVAISSRTRRSRVLIPGAQATSPKQVDGARPGALKARSNRFGSARAIAEAKAS
jgi:hypothetical protein